jgi:hypothetical protein
MNGSSVSLSHFALRSQLSSKKTFKDTPSVAIRIQSWCRYWLAAMVVGVCSEVVLAYNGQVSFLGLFVMIFALQGAITEYRGIRVDASSICIPLRSLPRLPMFTFWIKRIFLSEISSVTVKPPLFGIEIVAVTTLRGHSRYAYFSGRESRLWFLYLVKDLQPQIIVYRRLWRVNLDERAHCLIRNVARR